MTAAAIAGVETLSAKQLAKQEAILAAALELFANKGFHGTAVPEVAVLADVGTGTIYRYFENKEALVNAVFQRAKTLLRDTLDKKEADHAEDPRKLFARLWRKLVLFARTYPLQFRFLELQDHKPYLDDRSKAIEVEVLLPIWTYCVMARRMGISRRMPAEALMALIWGAFVGLMKAEYNGYLQLNEEILAAAEEACWVSFANPKSVYSNE